jgi:hypothetical protein
MLATNTEERSGGFDESARRALRRPDEFRAQAATIGAAAGARRRAWRTRVAAIGSLLGALVFAAGAAGEHGVLESVSTGPAGGNAEIHASFGGASADGSRVFFDTDEALVSADTDTSADVYERAGGQTALVSTGPAGGNGDFEARFRHASADGSGVFFLTDESLVSADTDAGVDIYERAGGQTALVSTGPAGGNGDFFIFFSGASADGSRVFFLTDEPLVSADTDVETDVYERAGGQTALVSTGPAGGNGDFFAGFDGASADGSRVFFVTGESLVMADTDGSEDVYERAGGQTTLVSTGPAGGNGGFDVSSSFASADGSRVFFVTGESLVGADSDGGSEDLYERAGGQTTLVSTGPVAASGTFEVSRGGVSADGARVFFETDEPLVGADTDAKLDVYERAAGQTTLVSTGPAGGNGAFNHFFEGASADGSRVLFSASEPLVGADTDAAVDVYERAGGQTALISTGPAGGNGHFSAEPVGASADGSRVFFKTQESLISADTDAREDVYERAGGQTTLVSTGPAGGNGDFDAAFRDASADGARVFFETDESLLSADSDTVTDVYAKSIPAPENPPSPPPAPGGGAAAGPGPTAGLLPGACANAQTGGAGIDTLSGSALGDRLRGLAGNDVLLGRAGDDCLSGGRGNDRLAGGPDEDRLRGGRGKDRLRGGRGADRLAGGRGRDTVSGRRGNDTINSRDGRRETVRCGRGSNDRVTADRADTLIGCERITLTGSAR